MVNESICFLSISSSKLWDHSKVVTNTFEKFIKLGPQHHSCLPTAAPPSPQAIPRTLTSSQFSEYDPWLADSGYLSIQWSMCVVTSGQAGFQTQAPAPKASLLTSPTDMWMRPSWALQPSPAQPPAGCIQLGARRAVWPSPHVLLTHSIMRHELLF